MTRRKSKAAEPDSAVPLQVALSDDIDEDALSKLLPEINLTSLSSDDVVSIYRLLLSQLISLDSAQRERDEARADTERKDIELDQALQDKETLSNDLEASVESAHKELHLLKQERDQLGSYALYLSCSFTHLFIYTHSGRQDYLAKPNHSHFRLSALFNF
jgi:nucleoprotein TPR